MKYKHHAHVDLSGEVNVTYAWCIIRTKNFLVAQDVTSRRNFNQANLLSETLCIFFKKKEEDELEQVYLV